MDQPAPIIDTRGMTRDFADTRAVDSLVLSIQPGELFALVGPDGAGKTTTLRIFAGLLDLTAGSATIAGFNLAHQPESIKPKIGYMAQQFSLYRELSVLENLVFFSDLYGVDHTVLAERMERLLDFAGLAAFKHRRAVHLSGGMQKKLALACTLVHQPEILLLDEPTTGVDPVSRREFWNILTELHIAGTTILVSTPYMDEADRCGRVGLMYGGRMVMCADPREIRAQIQGEFIEIQTADWQKARDLIQAQGAVREVQTYGEALHVLVDSAKKRMPELRRLLNRHEISVRRVRPVPARMEEAFISLIREMEVRATVERPGSAQTEEA